MNFLISSGVTLKNIIEIFPTSDSTVKSAHLIQILIFVSCIALIEEDRLVPPLDYLREEVWNRSVIDRPKQANRVPEIR